MSRMVADRRRAKLRFRGVKILLIPVLSCAAAFSLLPATPLRAADANGKEPALSDTEQKYLQGVVSANLGEIAMSYLAIEKSANNDVKSYALDIIDEHTKTMKKVLEIASRHNAFLALDPDLSAYNNLLKPGGAEFDKAYLSESQRMNQEATSKLEPLTGQVNADDVKSFVQDDLKDDKEHVKKAQDLAGKLQ